MHIVKADTKKLFGFCIYIRTIVFIQNQSCPLDEEINNEEDNAIDFIGLINNDPVATARYRIQDQTGKIERVAVLFDHQDKGLGKAMIMHLINEIQSNHDIHEIVLGGQDQAIPFYEKLGFTTYGDGYMEAGIPHHMMRMDITSND